MEDMTRRLCVRRRNDARRAREKPHHMRLCEMHRVDVVQSLSVCEFAFCSKRARLWLHPRQIWARMARAWSARAARLLVALALVTSAGGVREARAGSRLAAPLGPRRPRPARARPARGRSLGRDDARAREAPSALGLAYSSEESARFVLLAGAAYCDAGLESWTCPYCNGTDLVDVRVTRGQRNVRGYVGWDARAERAVVAFRGTEPSSLENWLENLDAHHSEWELLPEPGEVVPPPPVRVHAGFLDSWRELRAGTFAAVAVIAWTLRGLLKKGVNENALARRRAAAARGRARGARRVRARRLGVRRGGSGKTGETNGETDGSYERWRGSRRRRRRRARARWSSVRTFGSPRVGDILFAAAYRAVLGDRTWRVTHAHDVVPSVPVRVMGFHHVPTEVFYPGGDPGGINNTAPVVCDGGGRTRRARTGSGRTPA